MSAYYQYLWKLTWMETLSIILIGVFILCRFIWKVNNKAHTGLKRWDKILLILKGLGWVLIYSVYLIIFHTHEPDWFSKPVQVQAEIQGKSILTDSHYPYSIEVEWESGKETLYTDAYTYNQLETGQVVNVTFLPHRLQVVTCEILPLKAEEKSEEENLSNDMRQEKGEDNNV